MEAEAFAKCGCQYIKGNLVYQCAWHKDEEKKKLNEALQNLRTELTFEEEKDAGETLTKLPIKAASMGWQCPCCFRVWAPTVTSCNCHLSNPRITITRTQ